MRIYPLDNICHSTKVIANGPQIFEVLVKFIPWSNAYTRILAREGGGGVFDLNLGRRVPHGPWNADPVNDKKKFVKINNTLN